MKTPVRGLVLANTTQIYPEDRGTNYAVRLGDEAARAMLEWLLRLTLPIPCVGLLELAGEPADTRVVAPSRNATGLHAHLLAPAGRAGCRIATSSTAPSAARTS